LGLRALFNRRRFRRLALALFAALMVHLGLVLSGNWGILMFSAPSNQDRVLTLTLENTTYEGLKESSLKEEDTVNEAKVGKAAQTAPEKVNLEKPQDPQQREVKQVSTRELLKQEDLDDQSERGEQHDTRKFSNSANH